MVRRRRRSAPRRWLPASASRPTPAAPALLLPQLDTPHQGRAFTAALCAELPGARARHDAHEYLSGEADDPDAWFDACLRSGEE